MRPLPRGRGYVDLGLGRSFQAAGGPPEAVRAWDRGVFSGYSAEAGWEPWVSDGHSEARPLRDILPGAPSSDPHTFTVVGPWALFTAEEDLDPSARYAAGSYWATDGSRSGTRRLVQASGLPPAWLPAQAGAIIGTFQVVGQDGTSALLTDGTPAGSRLLSDDSYGFLSPRVIDGRIWFSHPRYTMSSTTQSYVSWRDLRSTALADILLSGDTMADVADSIVPLGTGIAFVAGDASTGRELWASDGTAAGTRLVLDLYPGPEGSEILGLSTLGGRALFSADDGTSGLQLWVTDGTAGATTPLTSIPGGAQSLSVGPRIGNALLFVVDGATGSQLWRTDGTTVGTFTLSSPDGDAPEDPVGFVGKETIAYFSGTDPAHGREPWRTDGTVAGTARIADIAPGPADSLPRFIEGDGVYFEASDGPHGRELWRLRRRGAALMADLSPGVFNTVVHKVVPMHSGSTAILARVDDGRSTTVRLFAVAEPNLRGRDGADADRDGFTNAVEFALGTDPDLASSTPLGGRGAVRVHGARGSATVLADRVAATVSIDFVVAPEAGRVGAGFDSAPIIVDIGGAVGSAVFHDDEDSASSRTLTAVRSIDTAGRLLSCSGELRVEARSARSALRRRRGRLRLTVYYDDLRMECSLPIRVLRVPRGELWVSR